jgi:hypothetical protein
MKSKRNQVAAILAVTNFFLLSHFSRYRFDQLQSYNWDIALMLTPFGIIKNFFASADYYLKPYYDVTVQLPAGHSFFPVSFFIVGQVVLSFYWLESSRKSGR